MARYLEQLTADRKLAMKAGEKDRLQVIRLAIDSIKQKQHELGVAELDEPDELAVLQKALKSRRDSIAQAEELGRDDVVARESAEIAILEAYLPAMMSGAELAAKVRELAAEIDYQGPKDTGRFMKEWMARHKGEAEGRDVQAALRAL